jgi:hypothetical protein
MTLLRNKVIRVREPETGMLAYARLLEYIQAEDPFTEMLTARPKGYSLTHMVMAGHQHEYSV